MWAPQFIGKPRRMNTQKLVPRISRSPGGGGGGGGGGVGVGGGGGGGGTVISLTQREVTPAD